MKPALSSSDGKPAIFWWEKAQLGELDAVACLEDQPHAKQIAYAPQPPMWSADEARERVPVARDAERPVSSARRKVAGRSQG
jgi:hypothetical protein